LINEEKSKEIDDIVNVKRKINSYAKNDVKELQGIAEKFIDTMTIPFSNKKTIQDEKLVFDNLLNKLDVLVKQKSKEDNDKKIYEKILQELKQHKSLEGNVETQQRDFINQERKNQETKAQLNRKKNQEKLINDTEFLFNIGILGTTVNEDRIRITDELKTKKTNYDKLLQLIDEKNDKETLKESYEQQLVYFQNKKTVLTSKEEVLKETRANLKNSSNSESTDTLSEPIKKEISTLRANDNLTPTVGGKRGKTHKRKQGVKSTRSIKNPKKHTIKKHVKKTSTLKRKIGGYNSKSFESFKSKPEPLRRRKTIKKMKKQPKKKTRSNLFW
jgi:hypothetical protein